MIPPEAAKEYSESLAQIGQGWFRQIAWAFDQEMHTSLGMSRREWREAYYPLLPRLDLEERREAVAELAAEGMSQREIADVLGVDQATVNRDLRPSDADASRELGTPRSGPGELLGADADASPEALSTRELLSQSDQNDWRTPRKFLDAARTVLGGIDLDPASSAEANQMVQASVFYTETDDGLKQPWIGRVWLNPPYGGQARLFVERLIREYQVGNVTAACVLVNSHPTETKWFQELFAYSVCFIRGRIDFGGPSREVSSMSTHGSAIAYLGPNSDIFAGEFRRFGAVVSEL